MKVLLDAECQAMLTELCEFMHLGPGHHPGMVKDALMTGLLSRWAIWRERDDHPDNVTIPDALRTLLSKPAPGADALEVEVPMSPAADRAALERAAELLREWGEPMSSLDALWRAATGIGLAKLCGQARPMRTGNPEDGHAVAANLLAGKPQEAT